MNVADLATKMIAAVRAQGSNPVSLAVSPDVYTLWQQQNEGIEPFAILGLPIRIRDNYKPQTMLVLGDRREEPIKHEITLDLVMDKIECGEYGPDPEDKLLVRSALREGGSRYDNTKVMAEFYESLERGRERFAVDALQAVGLGSHPRATDIFAFAEKMSGEAMGGDPILCAAILRRVSEFIHGD